MNPFLRRLLSIGIVGSLLSGIPCYSQERKLAVVVGVDVYRANSGLPALQHAGNDARHLSSALRQCGFTVYEMTQEVARQQGKESFAPYAANVRDQIDGVLSFPNLGPNDSILIAFHGHGVQFDQADSKGGASAKFFFCPADASVQGIAKAAQVTDGKNLIALQEIYDLLENCKAGTKLLVVDACRNDPSQPGVFRSGLASASLPKLPPPPGGTAAFFSCKANERAIEDPDFKQGVFTHFLVEGLLGKADQPLANKPADGVVTFAELTTYVANNTYSHVYDKYKIKQSPEMKGEYDLNLPLSKNLVPKEITNSIGMKLVLIKAGTFTMGSPESEKDRNSDETQHRVTLTQDFYLGSTEVTRGQFSRFVSDTGYKTEAESDRVGGRGIHWSTGNFDHDPQYSWLNPVFQQTDTHPVVNVSWNDAMKFIEWLSRKEGRGYVLPTEAQWEYACRAGSTTAYSFGNDPEGLAAVGNVADGAAKSKFSHWNTISASDGHVTTAPVGSFPANRFGLFDMHGNVSEWCADWGGEYPTGNVTDPTGPTSGSNRVFRGGSWFVIARYCRSAIRVSVTPDYRGGSLGFRVALGR